MSHDIPISSTGLLLASASPIRQKMLRRAGVEVISIPARIDEQTITESALAEGTSARDLVDLLAELKAEKLSRKHPDALVLGCDQLLEFGGQIIGKPKSKDALHDFLKNAAGQKHTLWVGNVLYRNGQPLWRHVGKVSLSMVDLSDDERTTYIDAHWDEIQHCAGGYRIEATPWLFRSVEGSWFDVLGLSLEPILNQLNLYFGTNMVVPRLAAVLGFPILQSKSPTIHGHWIQTHSLPGDYVAMEVPPAHFNSTIDLLRSLGFAGCNVTIPHKHAALAYANKPSVVSQQIGASNTLIFDGHQTIADNTDAYGFMANIKAAYPTWSAADGAALVLGAGGAARAIVWALLDADCPKIHITNRTFDKAQGFQEEFGSKVVAVPWEDRESVLPKITTLVNTTSLGMKGQPELSLNLATLNPKSLVNDIVYVPLETPLLKDARALGCATVDGLGMLLHQAVPGFEAWFGTRPVVTDELRTLCLS